MLDIQLLRNNLAFVTERLATRGVQFDAAKFEALEAERKQVQTQTQDLQAKRNSLSKQVGMLKGKGEDASVALAEVAGDAALLVDPHDSTAIARAMATVAADAHTKEELRAKGYVQAAKFSWDIAARRFLKIAGTITI